MLLNKNADFGLLARVLSDPNGTGMGYTNAIAEQQQQKQGLLGQRLQELQMKQMEMQQKALEESAARRKMWHQQWSPEVMDAGEFGPAAPSQAAREYGLPPQLAGLLSTMEPEQGQQVLSGILAQQMKPNDTNLPADYNAYIATFGPEKGKQMWAAAQQPASQPYFQTFIGPNGAAYQVDTRNPNNVIPLTVPGSETQMIDPRQNPASKAAMTSAETEARIGSENKAKKEYTMSGVSDVLDQAEDILNGKSTDKYGNVTNTPAPTSSGAGALLDSAGGFFGIAPKGANEAASLKILGANLVGKVPRFEGPQSDKDTQLYREAAGQVGDPTVPIETRKAAIKTLRRLWNQHISEQESKSGKPSLPKTPADISSDVVNQAREELRRRRGGK